MIIKIDSRELRDLEDEITSLKGKVCRLDSMLNRMESKPIRIHLGNDRYVSIVQDKDNTVEFALSNSLGIDSDSVKRYLDAHELAIELLKHSYSKENDELIEDTLHDR